VKQRRGVMLALRAIIESVFEAVLGHAFYQRKRWS